MHSLVISTRRYLSKVLILQTHFQVCSFNHAVCARTVVLVKLSFGFGVKAFRLDFILYTSSSTKTCDKLLKSLLQWCTNP